MKNFLIGMAVFIAAIPLFADDVAKLVPTATKPKITFPKVKVVQVDKKDVFKSIILNDDEWWVLESTVELSIIRFPEKALTVVKSNGEMTLGGVFIDGSGEDEAKKFAGPFVAAVKKGKDFKGELPIAIIPFGYKSDSEIVRMVLTLTAPQPPPKPPIPDVPVPDPPKPPIEPVTTSQKVTAALTGPAARFDAGILVVASGRIRDSMPEYVDAAQLQQHWKKLLEAGGWVKGSRPQITVILEEAMPATTGKAPPFTSADKLRITQVFKEIELGAKEVLK